MSSTDTLPSQPLFSQPLLYLLITQALLTVLIIGYFLHVQGAYFRRSRGVIRGSNNVPEKFVPDGVDVSKRAKEQSDETTGATNLTSVEGDMRRLEHKKVARKSEVNERKGGGDRKGGIGNEILGELEKRRGFKNQNGENNNWTFPERK
ncbi:3614_t:CDS:1 [Acaulospora colombiana]|uniref:3614_t:CDS:1 n=1 Tax=Acaulospora colombiana TaxID=27376 RepID=A0ACA9K2V5_9GLOM|nr:3614_t:CDS:1 [Acaulospora colombiana]